MTNLNISVLSASDCAEILAHASKHDKETISLVKARVADKAKTSNRKRWANLLKDINAGAKDKLRARAGEIEWASVKREAKPEPIGVEVAPEDVPPEVLAGFAEMELEMRKRNNAIDVSEVAALLSNKIPTKAQRARILALVEAAGK